MSDIKSVRNFWVVVDSDGRQNPIATGPRSRDGQMTITLYVRQNGQSKVACAIDCIPQSDGEHLRINIRPEDEYKDASVLMYTR